MFEYVVPGDDRAGYCLATDRFLLAISDGLQAGIPRIWPSLGAPDSRLEDVFEAIAGRGLSTMPAFAIAEILDEEAGSVRAIVHGEAIAQVIGEPAARIDGTGLATWREASWHGVDGVMIGLGSIRAGLETLPITGGVVRADWIRWRMRPAPAAGASSETPAPDQSTTAAQPTVTSPDGSSLADLAADLVADLGPAAATGPAPTLGALPAIRLGDGAVLGLELPIVLGRRPEPGLTPGGAPMVPVAVPSPRRLVSAAHLLVERHGDAVRLQDLETKNGSLIRLPDGAQQVLRAGASRTVPIGSFVELGEGVLLEIVAQRLQER